MKFAPQQEYYTQQIAAYTIQAGEILSNEVGQTTPKYRRLFLPKGHELYTWPLKAAWYLLLDPKVKHLILISKQSKYPDETTVLEEAEWILAFGHCFAVETPKIASSRITHKIDPEILAQLNFLTMLKEISSITVLGIWENQDFEDIAKQLKIFMKSPKTWVIYYDTCSEKVQREEARRIDELAMRDIFKRKSSKHTQLSCWLANLFVIGLPQRAEPDLLGYVNTWDFGGDQTKTTSYACLVA